MMPALFIVQFGDNFAGILLKSNKVSYRVGGIATLSIMIVINV